MYVIKSNNVRSTTLTPNFTFLQYKQSNCKILWIMLISRYVYMDTNKA